MGYLILLLFSVPAFAQSSWPKYREVQAQEYENMLRSMETNRTFLESARNNNSLCTESGSSLTKEAVEKFLKLPAVHMESKIGLTKMGYPFLPLKEELVSTSGPNKTVRKITMVTADLKGEPKISEQEFEVETSPEDKTVLLITEIDKVKREGRFSGPNSVFKFREISANEMLEGWLDGDGKAQSLAQFFCRLRGKMKSGSAPGKPALESGATKK